MVMSDHLSRMVFGRRENRSVGAELMMVKQALLGYFI